MDQELSPTMTVLELSARLGVDQSTASRYLRSGKLPGVQVGSRWLIDRKRVERFLAGNEDAAGNVLGAEGAPELVSVPELESRASHVEKSQALAWLHGLMAALELLTTTVENLAECEAPRRLDT